jgi:predicted enzyme related to lactoylglutathione lyase
MPNPVTHFEVIGEDGKKLQDFYSRVFSWKIDANNSMKYGMVSAEGGEGIGGGIAGYTREEMAQSGGGEEGRGVTFYVEVANLEATLKEVEQAGGKTVMGPDDVPGGPRMAQFKDPEGHRIGLVQAGTMPSANQS